MPRVSVFQVWLGESWAHACDNWQMYGEPVMLCDHLEPGHLEDDFTYWFARQPDTVVCRACFEVMVAAGFEPPCDHYGGETLGRLVLQPGYTVYAAALLCMTCYGATKVPAR